MPEMQERRKQAGTNVRVETERATGARGKKLVQTKRIRDNGAAMNLATLK